MTEIVTTWGEAMNLRANLSTELTNGRPATGERPRNLICRCVSLPTPRPFWFEYRRFIYISFAKEQSKRERLPQGYVIIYLTYPATRTTVLWLIHFLSAKNDYTIHSFVKSNQPLSFHYAISTSNSMCQFKTTQLKRKMSYQNI